jgi:hypothetical protein
MRKLKLSHREWCETLPTWAKEQRNNTISRQRIIEIAEREGIDTTPTGNHRWPPFAGALQTLERQGRKTTVSRGVYRIK